MFYFTAAGCLYIRMCMWWDTDSYTWWCGILCCSCLSCVHVHACKAWMPICHALDVCTCGIMRAFVPPTNHIWSTTPISLGRLKSYVHKNINASLPGEQKKWPISESHVASHQIQKSIYETKKRNLGIYCGPWYLVDICSAYPVVNLLSLPYL